MTNSHKELDDYIATLGLAYSAIFIPQSSSRNAKEKNLSINWSVSISPNHGKNSIQRGITTDYMQGIGHIPKYQKIVGYNTRRTLAVERFEKLASEQGRYAHSLDYVLMTEKLPAPLLRDVLYSLVMDSSVMDHDGFESWAQEFGYETDSRKAEKVYNDCLQTALKLRALIGDAAMSKLREMFQDY
jgi:hypothetical protein